MQKNAKQRYIYITEKQAHTQAIQTSTNKSKSNTFNKARTKSNKRKPLKTCKQTQNEQYTHVPKKNKKNIQQVYKTPTIRTSTKTMQHVTNHFIQRYENYPPKTSKHNIYIYT